MKDEAQTPRVRPIKTVPAGTRTLIDYDSLLSALGKEPTDPDRPLTVTKQRAIAISGLSLSSINRMIAAGRQSAEQAA